MKFLSSLSELFLCISLLTIYKNKSTNDSQINITHTSTVKNTSLSQSTQDSGKITKASKYNYFFEPEISIISGIFKTKIYYGSPGYGESPKTDSKETAYIFYPDHIINVINKKSEKADGEGVDVTRKGVIKFQLAPMNGISLHSLIGKRIKVIGTFYGKHTGHHHTDVLLAVTKVEKL